MSFPAGFPPGGDYGMSVPGHYYLEDGTGALGELGPYYYDQIMAERPLSLIEEDERLEGKAEALRLELERREGLKVVSFGAEKWNKYFGEVGVEPPLPPNIVEILSGPCPIWAGKRVEETHKLVLVPKTVNGLPLSLNSLGELIQAPKEGHKTQYNYYWDEVKKAHGETSPGRSHWVLMTRDVIPGSRNKDYATQQQQVAALGGNYEVPLVLDAAVAILMEHVETGVRSFSDAPLTYTRCQEQLYGRLQVLVGGFASAGLYVDIDGIDIDPDGVAAARKFCDSALLRNVLSGERT